MRDLPTDLNDHILRVELAEELMMNLPTGKTYGARAARIYRRDETPSGRTKWTEILKGPIVATRHRKPGEASYADLLRDVATLLEQQEQAQP